MRSSATSIATCFIIGMAIFLMNSLFLFRDVARILIDTVQNKVDVSVYFKDEATPDDILKLRDEILKIPVVQDVQYVSKDDAIENFKERYKDQPEVIQSLSEVGNPLLAALNIKAKNAGEYGAVASFLDATPKKDLFDRVNYAERKDLLDKVFKMTSAINIIGITLSVIFAIVAVLVTFNQIRLSIYAYREEIAIQRLVGASDWFIRGPFLIQGAIAGILAGITAFIVFGLSVYFLSPKISFFFSDLNILRSFVANFWLLLLLQFVVGIGLGVISSIIAMRRYLKV